MSKRGEGASGKAGPTPADKSPSRAAGAEATGRRAARRAEIARRKGKAPGRIGWFSRKRPVLRFVLVFGVCMGVYYGVATTKYVENTVFPAYLRLNATACAGMLNWFGEKATSNGKTVVSPRFSMTIERGCDAIEPSALFVSAVLALPAVLWKRLLGMAAGTILLMVLNLVRTVSLFFIGIYFPKAFQVMHFDVWQALFIFLVVVLLVLWALWANGRQRAELPQPS
jgi:exosortase H (IPTLxxWG-CTERM-specific)